MDEIFGTHNGYYRTSTTTARKKICYYRCLGSDDYRYQGGRVCRNKPVRADYLDAVVWDHITALLADPALIRAEIDRRLTQARTSDPVTRQRGQLELALAKAATAVTAMIEAYSEQLITIDELRARMPDLRARQTSLRSQLDALDTQAADRDAYLQLAGDLGSFLAQLRGNAATATVEDRQRVLRLLVKNVLIGPEKITIRHRIPVRERATRGSGSHDTNDTEGDMHPDYLLRWGRVLPEPGQRRRDPRGERAGRVPLVGVDRLGDLRFRVEQQDADPAAPGGRAGEDARDGIVGGVAELGHAVQPQLGGCVADDGVPLLPGDQAPVGVWLHRLRATGPGGRVPLLAPGSLAGGQAEGLRGDLERGGEPAQHHDVGHSLGVALAGGASGSSSAQLNGSAGITAWLRTVASSEQVISSGTGQGKRVYTVDPITIEVIDASLGCAGKRRG